MNAAIYILLACVRFPLSFLLLLVVLPLIYLNWALTGDMDHDEGLLGLVGFKFPAWLLDNINAPVVSLHKSYEPAAWTFKGAVATYRHSIRWWADRASNDFDYRQKVRANINCAKNKKEKRYWEAVKVRMEALIAQQEKA